MCDCLKLNLGSFCHLMMNDWADPHANRERSVTTVPLAMPPFSMTSWPPLFTRVPLAVRRSR